MKRLFLALLAAHVLMFLIMFVWAVLLRFDALETQLRELKQTQEDMLLGPTDCDWQIGEPK